MKFFPSESLRQNSHMSGIFKLLVPIVPIYSTNHKWCSYQLLFVRNIFLGQRVFRGALKSMDICVCANLYSPLRTMQLNWRHSMPFMSLMLFHSGLHCCFFPLPVHRLTNCPCISILNRSKSYILRPVDARTGHKSTSQTPRPFCLVLTFYTLVVLNAAPVAKLALHFRNGGFWIAVTRGERVSDIRCYRLQQLSPRITGRRTLSVRPEFNH